MSPTVGQILHPRAKVAGLYLWQIAGRSKSLTAGQNRLYHLLSFHCNPKGAVSTVDGFLAAELGVTNRQVRRDRRHLENLGFIGSKRHGINGNSCVFIWNELLDRTLVSYLSRSDVHVLSPEMEKHCTVSESSLYDVEARANGKAAPEGLVSGYGNGSSIAFTEQREISERVAAASVVVGVAENAPPPLPPPAGNELPQNRAGEIPTITAGDFTLVYQAMAAVSQTDDEGVFRLIAACRQYAPDATGQEIAHFIQVKAKGAMRAENPTGFLIRVVPVCFQGLSFRSWRLKHPKGPENGNGHATGLKQGLVPDLTHEQKLRANLEWLRCNGGDLQQVLEEEKSLIADPEATPQRKAVALETIEQIQQMVEVSHAS